MNAWWLRKNSHIYKGIAVSILWYCLFLLIVSYTNGGTDSERDIVAGLNHAGSRYDNGAPVSLCLSPISSKIPLIYSYDYPNDISALSLKSLEESVLRSNELKSDLGIEDVLSSDFKKTVTIVYIDDMEDEVKNVEKILDELGFEKIMTARDPGEAIEKVKHLFNNGDPFIVISDHDFGPKGAGYDLYKKLDGQGLLKGSYFTLTTVAPEIEQWVPFYKNIGVFDYVRNNKVGLSAVLGRLEEKFASDRLPSDSDKALAADGIDFKSRKEFAAAGEYIRLAIEKNPALLGVSIEGIFSIRVMAGEGLKGLAKDPLTGKNIDRFLYERKSVGGLKNTVKKLKGWDDSDVKGMKRRQLIAIIIGDIGLRKFLNMEEQSFVLKINEKDEARITLIKEKSYLSEGNYIGLKDPGGVYKGFAIPRKEPEQLALDLPEIAAGKEESLPEGVQAALKAAIRSISQRGFIDNVSGAVKNTESLQNLLKAARLAALAEGALSKLKEAQKRIGYLKQIEEEKAKKKKEITEIRSGPDILKPLREKMALSRTTEKMRRQIEWDRRSAKGKLNEIKENILASDVQTVYEWYMSRKLAQHISELELLGLDKDKLRDELRKIAIKDVRKRLGPVVLRWLGGEAHNYAYSHPYLNFVVKDPETTYANRLIAYEGRRIVSIDYVIDIHEAAWYDLADLVAPFFIIDDLQIQPYKKGNRIIVPTAIVQEKVIELSDVIGRLFDVGDKESMEMSKDYIKKLFVVDMEMMRRGYYDTDFKKAEANYGIAVDADRIFIEDKSVEYRKDGKIRFGGKEVVLGKKDVVLLKSGRIVNKDGEEKMGKVVLFDIGGLSKERPRRYDLENRKKLFLVGIVAYAPSLKNFIIDEVSHIDSIRKLESIWSKEAGIKVPHFNTEEVKKKQLALIEKRLMVANFDRLESDRKIEEQKIESDALQTAF